MRAIGAAGAADFTVMRAWRIASPLSAATTRPGHDSGCLGFSWTRVASGRLRETCEGKGAQDRASHGPHCAREPIGSTAEGRSEDRPLQSGGVSTFESHGYRPPRVRLKADTSEDARLKQFEQL